MIERVHWAIKRHINEFGMRPRRLQMTARQYLELDRDMKWLDKFPPSVTRNLSFNGIPIWITEEPDESNINGYLEAPRS